MPKFKLYHYWRSSSSWRVRTALAFKNIPYETTHVGLLNGESESEAHLKRNPAGFVPVLEVIDEKGNSDFFTESLAIIRYLEDLFPLPALLPGTPKDRAHIWAMAEVICSGTQPLQNIAVMNLHSSDAIEQKKWSQHWIRNGLEVYEVFCKQHSSTYSYGNTLTLADLCLVPQCYNADRYEIDFKTYPNIARVYENCIQQECFKTSHPDLFKA